MDFVPYQAMSFVESCRETEQIKNHRQPQITMNSTKPLERKQTIGYTITSNTQRSLNHKVCDFKKDPVPKSSLTAKAICTPGVLAKQTPKRSSFKKVEHPLQSTHTQFRNRNFSLSIQKTRPVATANFQATVVGSANFNPRSRRASRERLSILQNKTSIAAESNG